MDKKGLAGRKWPETLLAPLKFLKLAWQSEIASLKHEKFRSFRKRRPPSGHFLKAGGVDSWLFSGFSR